MADVAELYEQASLKTADNLRSIAQSEALRELSTLSLPEVDAVINLVARVIPAGNVPGVILNGLARLPGRKPPLKTFKRDINLLFQGIEQSLDKAVYAAVFAGPAAVIWGYQNLLKLAGKDPLDSFPEGLWQFYVDYAMREDTARHTNETHGFDTALNHYQLELTQTDRLTAWVMASIHALHRYDDLLRNEWRERIYISLLRKVGQGQPQAERYAKLYRQWEQQRPYTRPATAANETFIDYRQRIFDQFFEEAAHTLPIELQRELTQQAEAAKQEKLPAYQRQMSILAYLEANDYGENREPFSFSEAKIGLIHQGYYYLIAAATPGTDEPATVESVRQQIATILNHQPENPPVELTPLAKIRRPTWPTMKEKLPESLLNDLHRLRYAPILLNSSGQADLPLAQVRQVERGIGDHALTLIDTGKRMVFDQSHIFFDGAWGAGLAEILTNEALSWAVYLHQLPLVEEDEAADILHLPFSPYSKPEDVPTIASEANAETEAVNLKAIIKLRKLFKQRNDLLNLTVNDLLVLYRAIHAVTYQPNAELMKQLKQLTLTENTAPAAHRAIEAIEQSRQNNPSVVIPIDASPGDPQSRLYPMTFTVPLADLDLLSLHAQVMTAHKVCISTHTVADFEKFEPLQRLYLATLAGFGEVLTKAKEIAIAGESGSTGTMKLMAYIPKPMQRLLDVIPDRFEVLNDLIKGREVFSNVGSVVPSSSLTRFITAKDDNDKKALAWGILTDAQKQMRISLRDFRPHVKGLQQVGQAELANWIARDYLEAYAHGLNSYIDDLHQLTETSRSICEK